MSADFKTLLAVTPEAEVIIQKFISTRKAAPLDRLSSKIKALDLHLIPYGSLEYPLLLADIPDPPTVLFVQGQLLARPPIAVIGLRKSTPYGDNLTSKLVQALVDNGHSVVSGLAQGIDTAAHQAAKAHGGYSIAVLPGGHDVTNRGRPGALISQLPRAHHPLISEYPPGTPIFKEHFLARNRIIAGLAQTTIVTEASVLPSGSQHTANLALSYHREVWAIPGNITLPSTHGCYQLIDQGAGILWNFDQLFKSLPHPVQSPAEDDLTPIKLNFPTPDPCPPREFRLLQLIAGAPLSITQLAHETRFSLGELTPLLIRLELDGFVENRYGLWYSGTRYAPTHRRVPHQS